jgi:RNA polymerase primary sigma factor
MAQLLAEWRRAAARLLEELGREPTPDEVALRLGLSEKKLSLIRKALRVHTAGQEAAPEGYFLEGLLRADPAQRPDTRATAADGMRQVLGLLDRLDEREATVLRLRFGLGGAEPLTLTRIGNRMGLTRERIRQIEQEALAHLRGLLPAG